jgi:hypothetical protein
MVTVHKKQYMMKYNKQPKVKARKAEYMRKVRAEMRMHKARDMVNFLRECGYENIAFDYATTYAPDMLVTIKAPVKKRK